MVAVAHPPGAEVAVLDRSIARCGGLMGLLLPESLDPRHGQPPIRQTAEDAVGGPWRRVSKPARLVGGEHPNPGRDIYITASRSGSGRRPAGGPRVASAGHVQVAVTGVVVHNRRGSGCNRSCRRPVFPPSFPPDPQRSRKPPARCDVGLSLSERRLIDQPGEAAA